LTYEHLDYIRYKAYKNGLISGVYTYKNKIIKTPLSSYSHNLDKFFYIERIVNNMKENNELYTTIQSIFEKYFLINEKLDYFDGKYFGFPLIICKNYNYNLLTNSELKNMSNVTEREITFKINKIWINFYTVNLFLDVFDNMIYHCLTIEQLDYLCYKYNLLLNIRNNWVIDSPYKDLWERFTYKTHGKYYKYNYISRINIFLTLLDYKDNIYVENINSYIHKFWRKFYEKKIVSPLICIPWNINNSL
jgi:hypothetical protein